MHASRCSSTVPSPLSLNGNALLLIFDVANLLDVVRHRIEQPHTIIGTEVSPQGRLLA